MIEASFPRYTTLSSRSNSARGSRSIGRSAMNGACRRSKLHLQDRTQAALLALRERLVPFDDKR
jgi:hypothetical protein